MMNILLIAATEAEIAPLIKHIAETWAPQNKRVFKKNDITLEFCVCGVGVLATVYWLSKKMAKQKYDMILQVGVAGAYDSKLQMGEVVWVVDEQLGDLRVEQRQDYKDMFELGLLNENEPPFTQGKLPNPASSIELGIEGLTGVSGVTVSTVSGKQLTIDYMVQKHKASVETMEGAGLHYVCILEGLKFLQLRSISNYVEPRNKDTWKMKEAITNLNNYLIKYFDKI